MTLPAPVLDDRTFEELLRELQLLIPGYTPELAIGRHDWTDWNESDPGTTLLQLWAHLAEVILYRVNRLPDRAYVKFLEMVGLSLRPARPAVTPVTFTPQPGAVLPPAAVGLTVPERTPLRAQPPDGSEPVTFETTAALDLVRTELAAVRVLAAGAYLDVTEQNVPGAPAFPPLGWVPEPGNALYLGFAPPDPPVAGRVFPAAVRLHAFPPTGPGEARTCRAGQPPPPPPVTLRWEYQRGGDDPRWLPLSVFTDATVGFTRGGEIMLEGPGEIVPAGNVAGAEDEHLWLRCRLVDGAYPSGGAPRLDFLRPNTVTAESLATVRDEIVGTSEGHPDQTFTLRHQPMQPESLILEVEDERGGYAVWERRDDLLSAGPSDEHYTVDGATGVITFGDGHRGRIPFADAQVVAREYRHGATAAANVAAGVVSTVAVALPGVQGVTNLRAAAGGTDVQSVDDLVRRAPAELRSLRRAVTAADYAALALQVGTVARAEALPLAHPDHRGVEVPGSVTVVVVPDSDDPVADPAPRPAPALLDAVCRQLEAVRTVATELHVTGPTYRRLKVVARLEAEPYASFDTIRAAGAGAVNAYLDPLGRPPPPFPGSAPQPPTERGGGWPFGRDLAPSSLIAVLLGVEGVRAVPLLGLEVDGSPWDRPTESVVLDADGLFAGADDHEITVVPARDRTTRSVP